MHIDFRTYSKIYIERADIYDTKSIQLDDISLDKKPEIIVTSNAVRKEGNG